ncbi:MAG TPA: hypothetical protein VGW12_05670 [Pyrinomonadaceae bacterium]|nr:hypothetical protein [Pyrinomonadaceae bacterium]
MMTDEHEGHTGATPAMDNEMETTTDGAKADATGGMSETTAAASVETPATETVPASAVVPAVAAAMTANASETGATPMDNVRMRDGLEAIKTAIVWLVVIQILTILSPLLRLSLKWTLIVGFLLIASGLAVAVVAYRKAQRAQRSIPE